MIIYPAIDLYEGKAVRLFKGDYAQMTVYSEGPVAVAMDFKACGATHIQEAPADQAEDFPWMIVFIVLVVALLGAIVALVMVLKPKKK